MTDNNREKNSDELTLRDYFAAKVLPVIYTEAINFDESYASLDEVAEDAYRLADAMLKAKDKE